jgi:hypothetical protein
MTLTSTKSFRGSAPEAAARTAISIWDNLPVQRLATGVTMAASGNDVTLRDDHWQRWPGDEWACFDALPPSVRQRLQQHAYDPWAVNALKLWQLFRRQTGSSQRAERRLLRHLDACEAQERSLFSEAYVTQHSQPLPHVAAEATVLRDRSVAQMMPPSASHPPLRRPGGVRALQTTHARRDAA